jgi:hypothetical protein
MLQDKRAKEEGKGGQQAKLNRPEKGGYAEDRMPALAVAALPRALLEAPAGVSPSQQR